MDDALKRSPPRAFKEFYVREAIKVRPLLAEQAATVVVAPTFLQRGVRLPAHSKSGVHFDCLQACRQSLRNL